MNQEFLFFLYRNMKHSVLFVIFVHCTYTCIMKWPSTHSFFGITRFFFWYNKVYLSLNGHPLLFFLPQDINYKYVFALNACDSPVLQHCCPSTLLCDFLLIFK